VLAQTCVVVTLWAVFSLARAVVGAQHAVVAVLLMTGTAAFTVTTPAFGKPVLVAALITLACLHYWRAVGEGRGAYFYLLAIDIGLLLLTTYAGLFFVCLLAAFSTLTGRGRAALSQPEPWLAALIIIALLFPHLIWLDTADA